jgi:hypothetical protein
MLLASVEKKPKLRLLRASDPGFKLIAIEQAKTQPSTVDEDDVQGLTRISTSQSSPRISKDSACLLP